MGKKKTLCGIVEAIGAGVAHFFAFIDSGRSISVGGKEEDALVLNYTNGQRLYGVDFTFGSNRVKKIEDAFFILKRLKSESNGKFVLNFVKNKEAVPITASRITQW